MLKTEQIIKKYGKPDELGRYLTTIDLPYPMRISWDEKTTVKKMRCHKYVADKFKAVFKEILNEYGIEEIKKLRIDVFGGCFSFRKMRGGTDYSRHSWGIAIDLDPINNKMKYGKNKASFANHEYKKMIDIFYKHGFINLGIEKNYDFMHFEIAD